MSFNEVHNMTVNEMRRQWVHSSLCCERVILANLWRLLTWYCTYSTCCSSYLGVLKFSPEQSTVFSKVWLRQGTSTHAEGTFKLNPLYQIHTHKVVEYRVLCLTFAMISPEPQQSVACLLLLTPAICLPMSRSLSIGTTRPSSLVKIWSAA